MNDLLNALSQTPLPTILVLAGIGFWILAIAGSVAGKITVEPAKQKTAGLVGTAFIVLGLILFFAPGPVHEGDGALQKKTEAGSSSDGNRKRPSPGVNCTGSGTPDETKICGSATLAELDWQLYDAYQASSARLDQNEQAKLAREEAAWVKQRGECQSDQDCIAEAYRSRIDQLRSAH